MHAKRKLSLAGIGGEGENDRMTRDIHDHRKEAIVSVLCLYEHDYRARIFEHSKKDEGCSERVDPCQ